MKFLFWIFKWKFIVIFPDSKINSFERYLNWLPDSCKKLRVWNEFLAWQSENGSIRVNASLGPLQLYYYYTGQRWSFEMATAIRKKRSRRPCKVNVGEKTYLMLAVKAYVCIILINFVCFLWLLFISKVYDVANSGGFQLRTRWFTDI